MNLIDYPLAFAGAQPPMACNADNVIQALHLHPSLSVNEAFKVKSKGKHSLCLKILLQISSNWRREREKLLILATLKNYSGLEGYYTILWQELLKKTRWQHSSGSTQDIYKGKSGWKRLSEKSSFLKTRSDLTSIKQVICLTIFERWLKKLRQHFLSPFNTYLVLKTMLSQTVSHSYKIIS